MKSRLVYEDVFHLVPMTKSGKKPKKTPKLTLRQSRFAKAFMKARSASEAAILAGYSKKYARTSAYQAMKSEGLREKVSEMLDKADLSVQEVIYKHLHPLLIAKTVKVATHEGEITDYMEFEDNDTRHKAVDTVLRMHGAYAPRDMDMTAQIGVKVIIVDTPRPARGVVMADVGPGALPSSNGHKATDE